MKKRYRKLSFISSLFLVLQLLLPAFNAFAAEAAPTNLNVTVSNINDITLKWDKVFGVDNYNIYLLNGEERELFSKAYSNSWGKKGLAEGEYTVAVTYVKGSSESEVSVPVSFVIKFPETQAPANLKAMVENVNDITLKWDAAGYTDSYNVFEVKNGERILIANTTSTSRSLPKLAQGNYVYEVTSVSNRFGESKAGSRTEVSIVYPEIQAPTGLTATIRNENDLTLQWKPMEYANSYNVYEVKNGERTFVENTTTTSRLYSRLAEGEYHYEVTTVSDRFGESKLGSPISVTIVHPDILAPNLTATVTNHNDLALKWETVNYANSYNVYEVINGERKLIANTTGTSRNFSRLAEGDYLYEVTSVSNRFGESSDGSKVAVSIVYPEILAPENFFATVRNGNDLALTWQEAAYADKYYIYEVINGERKLVAETVNTSHFISDLAEGEYVYEIETESKRFGKSKNTSQVTASIVYPEMSAPVIELTMRELDSATISWEKVPFAEEYNIYEVVDGQPIFKVKAFSNGYGINGLSEGIHEFVVTSVNSSFGESNYSNKVMAEVVPEGLPDPDPTPELPAPVADEPEVNGDDVTLSWEPVEGAGSYNIYEEVDGEKVLVGSTTDPTFTVKDLEPGDHEFIIVPVDESGVESDEFTRVPVTTDEDDITPPVTSSNVEDKWLKESLIVKLTATDDLSGVEKTYYSVNGSEYVRGATVFVSDPGVNTISFFSVDYAGNIEEVKTVEVKIDTTAPVTTANVTDLAVELTATDDLSGVLQTFYSVNGSEFEEGNSIVVSNAGLNRVVFYSVDNAGNVEEVRTVEVNTDTNAPETVSNVNNQWYQGEVSVELTATDDKSGVAHTFYSINESEFVEGTSFAVSKGVNEISFY
ncbi:OmpL47-type beta-barrel domain-containing protein, partial [Neobacillus niacini]|uniref:OmpL47-type beta-barrel domain-containing protein n=1 Tax=Neobacillus niacini TaxID=86668 RepID=UPI003B5864C0